MSSTDFDDHGQRLRELLSELGKVVPAPRSDPNAERELALCAEVEAILRMRFEARAGKRAA